MLQSNHPYIEYSRVICIEVRKSRATEMHLSSSKIYFHPTSNINHIQSSLLNRLVYYKQVIGESHIYKKIRQTKKIEKIKQIYTNDILRSSFKAQYRRNPTLYTNKSQLPTSNTVKTYNNLHLLFPLKHKRAGTRLSAILKTSSPKRLNLLNIHLISTFTQCQPPLQSLQFMLTYFYSWPKKHKKSAQPNATCSIIEGEECCSQHTFCQRVNASTLTI